jgi:hypothetical protein
VYSIKLDKFNGYDEYTHLISGSNSNIETWAIECLTTATMGSLKRL